MPRLSLYRDHKSNNYRYFDRIVSAQYRAGGTDCYLHMYQGPPLNTGSKDATQPAYNTMDPKNIQDLLFLENRERKYADDIVRLRIHYQVANLDFDLSQFGLFLSNDVIFLTCHYNDMIDLVGRKIMVGDVIELPHLTDYHPLNDKVPASLRRYYQVTDGSFASEGYSQTWLPHLWRIKCEPLVNSQEFADILDTPTNTDNYLGKFDKSKGYPAGYTIKDGGKTYISTKNVPAGITPPNSEYWKLDETGSLSDILSTYNTNIAINDAVIAEANNNLPMTGFDRSNLYVIPTDEECEPALPVSIITENPGPNPDRGMVEIINTPGYSRGSIVVRFPATTSTKIGPKNIISIMMSRTLPNKLSSGSGPVSGEDVLSLTNLGTSTTKTFEFPVMEPFGTADNYYATADQDIDRSGFIGESSSIMDYLADCDPRFLYVGYSSPKSFGYLNGYMVGDATAPNGLPMGSGITFPSNPKVGDYFLRIDYLPQILFRWDGRLWVKISQNIRTGFGFDANNKSQLGGFITNNNDTKLTDGTLAPEKVALSKALRIKPD